MMKTRTPRIVWEITVGVFLCMTLWPLWSARFPPMQDYPGQLFYSQVLHVHNDPAFDYNRYYDYRFHPTYATFYLTTLFFAKFVPIEIAGKLSLSLYPALIAIVVLRLRRRLRGDYAPWGALLLFPFAFNQQYFFGNINYVLSLPLLILALLDFEDFMGGFLGAWPIVRHSLWQVVLYVTHPLSFLVYVSMAVIGAITTRRQTSRFWSKLAAAMGIAFLLFLAFWVGDKGIPRSDVSAHQKVGWLSPLMTLEFFALMFDGMQSFRNADSLTLSLWGGILVILLGSLVLDWRTQGLSSSPVRYLIFFVMALLGMLVLPFHVGDFSYINVRFAAMVYFLAALVMAQVRFRGWLACCLVGLLGLCLLDSAAKQARISAEIDEILPVVRRIPPHSRVLPLVFDPGSPELDRYWFAPSVQTYNYYHVIVGGGFNPYLFGSPFHPVQPKRGEERPSPGVARPDTFSWEVHAADYQYFLVQGALEGLPQYLELHCDRVFASGKWMLFERRPE